MTAAVSREGHPMADVCTECGLMAHMWGTLTPSCRRASKYPCGRSFGNADDVGAPQDADAELV